MAQQYQAALLNTEYVQLLSLSIPAMLEAAMLRANYNLRTLDALQLAACIMNKCSVFVTNDRALKRVNEIKVLILSDFTVPTNGADHHA